MSGKNPSYTKCGPGRFHISGPVRRPYKGPEFGWDSTTGYPFMKLADKYLHSVARRFRAWLRGIEAPAS